MDWIPRSEDYNQAFSFVCILMVHLDEIDDLPWDFYHLGFFRNYPDAVEYGELFFQFILGPERVRRQMAPGEAYTLFVLDVSNGVLGGA